MIPVEQRVLTSPGGDCFAACVASILECPIEAVPNYHGARWWLDWQRRLEPRGLALLDVPLHADICGYAILHADSPRLPGREHAVVTHDGAIVWDPHPRRDMGVGAWRSWTVFVALDPARALAPPPPFSDAGA